jgi:hypothetical protein
LQVLRGAVAAGAGDPGGLSPSVAVHPSDTGALPPSATVLVGRRGDADADADGWLRRVSGWISGRAPHDPAWLGAVGAGADRYAVGAVLHDGPGAEGARPLRNASPVASLDGAVPAGHAWVVASDPERFFAQLLPALDGSTTPQGQRLAGRLRDAASHVAVVRRTVRTVALSLELSPASWLRFRVICVDGASAFQAAVVLEAWRARRGGYDDRHAPVFTRAAVSRVGAVVEVRFSGTREDVLALLVPAMREAPAR